MDAITGCQFKAYIGLDWADTKHDVCIQVAGEEGRDFECIPHRVDKIEDWVVSLYQRTGGPIAVVVELTRGPIVYALQKYGFIEIVPVNSSTLARYRQLLHPSGAKDDPTDAELMLDLVLKHPERFCVLESQSAKLRELHLLVEHRRQLVADKVRFTNRLCSTLKQYYPQSLEWFEKRDTRLFCEFISRWPTLRKVQRARTSTLEKFFHDHRTFRKSVLTRRLEGIRTSRELTDDDALVRSYALKVQVVAEQLKLTLTAIDQYDKAIADIACDHPDYGLFAALPGAGSALAPRLLVAFGEQRERFKSADELQMYAGIAPVTERSGQKQWVHWRTQCPRFLRQTFVEWASHSIGHSYWAERYYRQQRSKGKSHQAAVRSLAFKWVRVLYRCWQTRTPYDESKYLKALKKRGSPLVATAA